MSNSCFRLQKVYQEDMSKKQPVYDRLTKSSKRRNGHGSPAPHATPESKGGRRGSSKIPKAHSPSSSFAREKSREKLLSASPSPGYTREKERTPSFTRSGSYTRDRHPGVALLSKRWQRLWLMSMERLRRLQERLEYLAIVSRLAVRTDTAEIRI